jgi:hypothetical protein
MLRALSRRRGLAYPVARALFVVAQGLSIVPIIANVFGSPRRPGPWLVALGGVCNLAVVLANGGVMPVAFEGTLGSPLYTRADQARLAVLGDQLPIGGWIVSPGDVLMGLGLVVLVASAQIVELRSVSPG